jgi:TonB-dependent starch-binding outer membrane protein SusC
MPKKINLLRRHALIVLSLVLLSFIANSQTIVNGKVTGPDSKPVFGASVTVKSTNVATSTAQDGTFGITLPAGKKILVISYVGYEISEVNVTGTTVDVVMKTQTTTLNEVVITGYTAQKKKELTGAVSVVKTSDLIKVASPSFLGQIEGRASGIQTTSSGSPGTGVSLRIRGNSTFTEGGGDPLIVIDGLQVKGAFQNQINPNDIESIQILKDAATTASYGIGANNGVIIITTKKGKAGQAKVDVSSYYGTQASVKTYQDQMIKTSAEYADLIYQSYKNPGQWPQAPTTLTGRTYGVGATPVLPAYVNPLPATPGGPINTTYNYPDNLVMRASPGTDWWAACFRTDAPITEHNVSVSGSASNSGRYFFSANYFAQDGVLRYTDYNKYSVRGNTEFKVKGFTIGENLTVVFDNYVGLPNGNQVEQNPITEGILKMQPIIPVYDEGGNWGGTKAGFGNGKNGLAKLYRNKDNRGEGMRVFGNVYGEVKILNHFTGRLFFGVDHGWQFGKGYNFSDPESNEVSGSGFNESTNRQFSWIAQQQISYNNTFGNHDIKATAVHEAKLSSYRNINASLSGYQIELQSLWYINTAFGDPATRSIQTSGGKNNAKESYLGRVEYGYKGKYLLNATIRHDASSNFAENKGQMFGGVGLAWRASDEAFLKNVRWINDLKVRAAWGVTGNDAIDGGRNYALYGGGPGQTFYDINGTNTSAITGYAATSAGLPVVWEKQKQYNIGIDALLFKNRLETSIDLYKRTNADFLFAPGQPAPFGAFGGAVSVPYYNIGKIENHGIEMSFNWKDNIAKDWKYEVGVNLTFNNNRISELAPSFSVYDFFPSTPESRIGPLVRDYGPNPNIPGSKGSPMGTFYGLTVDGIYQSAAEVNNGIAQDGKAVGRFRWKDINGDKKIDNEDKGIIGDPNPNVIFGFNVGLSYKSFDFSMFVQGTLGNDIFNYVKYFTDFYGFSGNRSNRMLYQSWTPTRTDAILPMLDVTDNYSFQPSTYYVEDGSYLRAKVLQIGYKLPASLLSKAKIDNARIYIQGQNLFTITKYQGIDPALGTRNNATEQWTGIDYGNYPNARVLMVGLNLSF